MVGEPGPIRRVRLRPTVAFPQPSPCVRDHPASEKQQERPGHERAGFETRFREFGASGLLTMVAAGSEVGPAWIESPEYLAMS